MPKSLKDMTNSEINRALAAIDKKMSVLTNAFIDAGMGHLRMSEIAKLDDPLSREWNDLSDARSQLQIEKELRYGPGLHGSLPKGGARKWNSMANRRANAEDVSGEWIPAHAVMVHKDGTVDVMTEGPHTHPAHNRGRRRNGPLEEYAADIESILNRAEEHLTPREFLDLLEFCEAAARMRIG